MVDFSAEASAPEGILARYAVYAEVLGAKRDPSGEGVPDGPDGPDAGEGSVPEQAAFSLRWFYRHLATMRRLNGLARAYLGDAGARARLRFARADRASFAGALLEGAHPLNDRQLDAIAWALESDLSLVQGPPGTGKTETILNVVSCMLARGATVAVVANNRKAIDNIAEKVAIWADDEGAGANRRRVAASYARLGNAEARSAWAEGRECPDDLRFYAGKADRAPEGWRRFGVGGWEPAVSAERFLARYPFVTSTVHSLKKCFADGDSYQYDYVIMDEASQCNPLLALVAMSSARRLVLVGDVEQLPPVFDERLDAAARAALDRSGLGPVEDPAFALQGESGEGMSVIASVERCLAGAGVPRTFLNKHYRCHPGIIGFCSDSVYAVAGEPLEIATEGYDESVDVPIRIRWFEGNYCEPYCFEDDAPRPGAGAGRRAPRTSRCNYRQVEVFMREEWPELRRRMAAEPGLSACVLSPYRGQLDALRRRIERDGAGEQDLAVEGGAVDDPLAAGAPPMLTVHKAQGQEFDIVYLMPGEDGSWEWSWTEGKSLVNVAVSRARRELVAIVSSCLMGVDVQEALLGAAHVVEPYQNMRDVLTDEERRRREAEQGFVRRLVDYVRASTDPARAPGCRQAGFPESAYAFGFHRSGVRSVFDEVPRLRRDGFSAVSAPELLVSQALYGMRLGDRGLAAACSVPLAQCLDTGRYLWEGAPGGVVSQDAGERLRFIEHGAHFDFVLYEVATRRIVLAIEVDGEQHRTPVRARRDFAKTDAAWRRRMETDSIKDAIVRDFGGTVLDGLSAGALSRRPGTFALLRLATNGASAVETDRLREAATGGSWTTIEDVVAWQLAATSLASPRIDGSAPLRPLPAMVKPVRSLTKLLDAWRSEGCGAEAAGRIPSSAAQANRRLEARGVIERDVNRDWRPTAAGRALGLVEVVSWFESGCHTVVGYPEECDGAVRRLLAE